MAELDKGGTVTLEQLMVSTLATIDALAKLLIEKRLITDAEFRKKLGKGESGGIKTVVLVIHGCFGWFWFLYGTPPE